jgi:hypothetical protein
MMYCLEVRDADQKEQGAEQGQRQVVVNAVIEPS